MTREFVHLQYLTLGSLLVLVVLCGLLLVMVRVLLLILERSLVHDCEENPIEGVVGPADRHEQPAGVDPETEAATDISREGARDYVTGAGTGGSGVLRPRDTVIVVEELNWLHGTGTVVPVGEILTLVSAHTTSCGLRWSARWQRNGQYLSSIPPESIRRWGFQPSPSPPRSPLIPHPTEG